MTGDDNVQSPARDDAERRPSKGAGVGRRRVGKIAVAIALAVTAALAVMVWGRGRTELVVTHRMGPAAADPLGLGDINGDGRIDVIDWGDGPADLNAIVQSAHRTWRSTTMSVARSQTARFRFEPAGIGDVNSDGRSDLIELGAPGQSDAGTTRVSAATFWLGYQPGMPDASFGKLRPLPVTQATRAQLERITPAEGPVVRTPAGAAGAACASTGSASAPCEPSGETTGASDLSLTTHAGLLDSIAIYSTPDTRSDREDKLVLRRSGPNMFALARAPRDRPGGRGDDSRTGDINGDGVADSVEPKGSDFGTQSNPHLSEALVRNGSTGQVSQSLKVWGAAFSSLHDVTGDRRADLVFIDRDGRIKMRPGQSDGRLGLPRPIASLTVDGRKPWRLHWGDVVGSPSQELFVQSPVPANEDSAAKTDPVIRSRLFILRADRPGHYGALGKPRRTASFMELRQIRDMDADGRSDLLWHDYQHDLMYVSWGMGNGVFR